MSDQNIPKLTARLTSVIIQGIWEFVGQSELDQILSISSEIPYRSSEQMLQDNAVMDFSQIGALQRAVEHVYGPQGARGFALRSGRAAFCYFLKNYGERTGFGELDFRLLPPRQRLRVGLERMAQVISAETGGEVSILDGDQAWQIQIDRCPECWNRKSEAAECYFSVGMVQEFLGWQSGGKIYLAEETACQARGDPACVIRVEKKPLD